MTCYELTENTQLSAQGRGGRAEQGAGQGAAAGCVPAPTRPASINSWQFGARTSAAARTCRFLTSAAALASLASCYRQVRLVCVCVRARKHVGTNFIPDQPTSTRLSLSLSLSLCLTHTHTHTHTACMHACMYVCMYVRMRMCVIMCIAGIKYTVVLPLSVRLCQRWAS